MSFTLTKQNYPKVKKHSRPHMTAEEMLTMSSAVKEWHEKMEQYKSQKDEILQKVQSLNEDLNGKGPKKKKPSKKEKEEIDKELFALNQELDVVEANIVEMGEPPATGQLKRKDKSKEPELAPGAVSTLDYRRSALLGYGDRNAALALINNSEKRHSAPEPDKRKIVTPAGRPTSVGAPVPNGIKVDKSTDTTPAPSPNQSAISPSPTTTTTPAPPSLTPEEKKKDTPTHPEDEGEKSTSEGGSAGNNNNNEGKSGGTTVLSKKEERAKKKEEEKKKRAAKKASDKKKKEAADFVITRKD